MAVHFVSLDVGDFPAPPAMIEAAKTVKWRKNDRSWPDMRTKAGKRWVQLYQAFSDQKIAAMKDGA